MAIWPSAVATDADLYVAVNSIQTTLSTGLGTSDVSVVLASATSFPSAGAVTIGNEVIFYTGVSGNTLTGCTRGADGTTAATHSVGVPVGASIIAFHHNGLKNEIKAIESYLDTVLGKGTAVTATEFGYVHGVTSAIQTQLDAKASTGLGNLASVAINTSLLPASDNAIDAGSSTKNFRSVYVSTSIKNASTTLATATELGYLTGVTSAIQTQFSGKASTALDNLASVAINLGLTPGTDNSIDLGSSSKRWVNLFAKTLNAGASGTAGSLSVFPATSSKGKLLFSAVDNSGDFIVTITNAAQAAARTYTIPDAGASASFVMTEGAQTINGVKTFTADIPCVSLNNTFLSGLRNRIINGDMRLNQRNSSNAITTSSATLAYNLDRWAAAGQATDGVFTTVRSTSTPPTGFTHFLRTTVTTADASIGAAQVYKLTHYLEGNVVRDFLLGTASAKTFTLSFWVRSSLSGTFGGAFSNSAADRSYPFTYTISATNTWEQKTVTVAGDTSGTWLTTTGIGLALIFDLGVGSTGRGTAGSWAGAAYYGATGDTSLIGTNAATLDLTGVQLEIGSSATSFEYRSEGVEFFLCQRYYEKSYLPDTAVGANDSTNFESVSATQTGVAEVRSGLIRYKVPKRAQPTVTFFTTAGTAGSWTWRSTAGIDTARASSANTNTTNGFNVDQAVALEYWGYGHWSSEAEL